MIKKTKHCTTQIPDHKHQRNPPPSPHNQQQQQQQQKDLEILKAVAQAWHAHSGSNTSNNPSNEYSVHRRNFQRKPSRFKIEAMKRYDPSSASSSTANWDFGRSLLDSYEIVTVTKRLERGLDLDKDNPFSCTAFGDYKSRVRRRRKEGKNSLRNLFNLISSRRFNESEVPREDKNQFS